MNTGELALYRDLLGDIKTRVRQAQTRAALSANAEMILMYWDVGRMIAARQQQEGWGAGVIPRLAVDLKNELPEEKGFSVRNLKLMVQFYQEYADIPLIGQRPVAQLESPDQTTSNLPQPVAKLGARPVPILGVASAPGSIVQRAVAQLSWAHNIILMQKVKDLPTRLWYARQTLEQGWSRDTLVVQIKSRAHERQGGAITNPLNFYCSVVDDQLRREYDAPTLGMILCQTKDRILAEYALRDIHKPIGVADYEITRALPKELASSLPSIEAIEAELSENMKAEG